MMQVQQTLGIIRVRNKTAYFEQDTLISEHALQISINDEVIIHLSCTPKNLEELVIGHLFSQGFIHHHRDIELLQINEDLSASVRLRNFNSLLHRPSSQQALQNAAIQSASPHNIENALTEDAKIALPVEAMFSYEEILERAASLQNRSVLFQKTGGVHACELYCTAQKSYYMEDIGRHNAFDKTLGAALRDGVPFANAMLLTTGRVPNDILFKAIVAKLPILVSRSAPTAEAVGLAREHNITLCGFARDRRMNIYSVPERIYGITYIS